MSTVKSVVAPATVQSVIKHLVTKKSCMLSRPLAPAITRVSIIFALEAALGFARHDLLVQLVLCAPFV